MFWEVSGIGSEVIGLLWNMSYLEYSTGLLFLGLFLSFIVLLLFFSFGHSCFWLWFLTVASVSNTQGINSTSSWVYDHTNACTGSTYVARWFG